MTSDRFWQLQIKSEMLDDEWNVITEHSTEPWALERLEAHRIAHPARTYRVVRYDLAHVVKS